MLVTRNLGAMMAMQMLITQITTSISMSENPRSSRMSRFLVNRPEGRLNHAAHRRGARRQIVGILEAEIELPVTVRRAVVILPAPAPALRIFALEERNQRAPVGHGDAAPVFEEAGVVFQPTAVIR